MSAPAGAARAPIRRLDAKTVSRIAAGEVVERPASVVKELVENAYDAGATEVRVSLSAGGTERIAVADDGVGIPSAELALALERHATSKLASAEGLATISTLGFRGEALASIASVSRLTLVSRTPGIEEAHAIEVDGGQLVRRFVTGAPPGTTVEVRSLFFNTPARQKFLRTPPAEQVEVLATVGAQYLARPDVGLTLDSEGTELLRYPRTESLKDAAVRVLGLELLDQIFEVSEELDRGVRLRAVLGRPAISRGTSQGLYLAVNGRPIVSRPLAQAIRQAYDDYLPRTRFPIGVAHLEIDPTRVDVNVHPTKREIRIARERELADRLRRAVRTALANAPQVADRGSTPRSREASSPTGIQLPRGPRETDPVTVSLAFAPAESGGAQRLLDEPSAPRAVVGSAGHPRIVLYAPLFHLYWVGETADALVLVDQHAASERVVYEALLRDGRLARQELVQPVVLPLTPQQAAVLRARNAEIEPAGFGVEPFGSGHFRVTSVPVYRGHLARADALPALLNELADGGRPTVPNGLVERTAASIACHAAVRAGDVISSEEMGRILDALYRLPEASYACPHGRPIIVRLPRGRLDRWFLRSGD